MSCIFFQLQISKQSKCDRCMNKFIIIIIIMIGDQLLTLDDRIFANDSIETIVSDRSWPCPTIGFLFGKLLCDGVAITHLCFPSQILVVNERGRLLVHLKYAPEIDVNAASSSKEYIRCKVSKKSLDFFFVFSF